MHSPIVRDPCQHTRGPGQSGSHDTFHAGTRRNVCDQSKGRDRLHPLTLARYHSTQRFIEHFASLWLEWVIERA